MSRVFTYGTLEIPRVMEAVTGQTFLSQQAIATDYVRYLLKDREYPGMTFVIGETTSGRLYRDVDWVSLQILDEFEDEVYTRELITVETLDGQMTEAYAYLISLEHQTLLTKEPWRRDFFLEHVFSDYVRSCRAFYREVRSRSPF